MRRTDGLCPRCGVRPREGKHAYCAECRREKAREYEAWKKYRWRKREERRRKREEKLRAAERARSAAARERVASWVRAIVASGQDPVGALIGAIEKQGYSPVAFLALVRALPLIEVGYRQRLGSHRQVVLVYRGKKQYG